MSADENEQRILVIDHKASGIERVSDMGEGAYTAIWFYSEDDLRRFMKAIHEAKGVKWEIA